MEKTKLATTSRKKKHPPFCLSSSVSWKQWPRYTVACNGKICKPSGAPPAPLSVLCYITFVCKHSTNTPFRAAQSNNADAPPPWHFWQPIGWCSGRCVCDWPALNVAHFGLAVSPCGLAVLLTYFLSEKGRAAVGGSPVHVIWIGLSLLSVKVVSTGTHKNWHLATN